jgi:hypothetical protein
LSSLSVSRDFIDQNSVTWSVNNPTANAWTWTLSVNGIAVDTRAAAANSGESSTRTYVHRGLAASSTHEYSLTAIRNSTSAAPTSSGYTPRTASATTWPFGDTFIDVTSPTSTSLRVSGQVQNNAVGASWEYRIRRLKSNGTDSTIVKPYYGFDAGTKPTFDFVDTGLSSSTTYIYYLEVRNENTKNLVQYFPAVGWIANLNTTQAPIPAPVFTSSPPSSASLQTGSYYEFYIQASNTTSFSLTNVGTGVPLGQNQNPGLPSGMTLNTQNQSGTSAYAYVSGTPTTVGNYYWGIRADGPGGSSTLVNRIWSVSFPIPSFTDSSVTTNWVVNKNYSLASDRTVTASNASSYSIVNPGTGTFASWLSINSSGQLSGTPTVTGTYSFRVRATGPGGDIVDTATISIVVHGIVSWVDQTLADGIKGVPYSDRVEAQNATAYSISPAFNLSTSGLSFNPLSGLIAGTPKEIASYTFTITASNPGNSISKQFTISFKSGGKRIEGSSAVTISNKKRYNSATSSWVEITNAKRWSASANQWIDISN